MMTSDDKVGEWVKKGQNDDDVIFQWSPSIIFWEFVISFLKKGTFPT